MNARRPLLPLLCLMVSVLPLTACFGSYNNGPPLPLAVEFTTAPPTTDTLGTSFQVAAAVSNNSKVNWACLPAGACGSFNPTQTASSAATTYMPPATVPAGGSVTIEAISVQDMTKEASANVTITAGGTVSVTFNAPAPPPSLATNAVAQVSAMISSMLANAVNDGIDWTATCTNGAGGGCGMFSAAHTNSGVSTTYTPPATVPAGGVAVTIKAASTLDPLDSVTAVINVSATQTSAFLCALCSYTYTVSGENANGSYGLAGVFTTDGLGNITGGEQDFSEVSFSAGTRFSTGNAPDMLASGTTYSFGADGRGTITLSTGDNHIGTNGDGMETLGVVFISPNHLLITELDQSATASGTMDLQTVHSFSTSTLSGGFAFVVGGADLAFGAPLGFGGVFNIDSTGTISGTGSTADINDGGSFARQQSLNGSYVVSDPLQLGRIQLTLHSGAFNAVSLNGPMILDGYITDATHVKFVEVDSNAGVSSGLAFGQGTSTGKLNSASVLPANTNYVFTAFGEGVTGALALAATLTSDGMSNLQNKSGGANADVNAAGVPSSGSVTGTYTVDGAGTGRVGVTLNGNVGNPGNTGIYAIYLTGGADPPLVLELDHNSTTTGNLYTQSAGPFSLASFQGSYGLNFTLFGFDAADNMFDIEVDITGQCLADGAGNLLGTLDINDNGAPKANQAFTGAYASSASGRFTGSITSTATSTLGFSYFVVSPSQVVIIETDSQAVSLGLFQRQTPPF